MWWIIGICTPIVLFIGWLYYMNWKYCRNVKWFFEEDDDGLH